MRDGWKLAVATALATLLLAGLAACGDDSGDSTSSSATTSESGSVAPDSGSSATARPDSDPAEAEADSGSSATDPDSSSSAGSASFRTRGGDNSIQDFGEEAEASKVEAASAALAAYMRARAGDEWARECEYLAAAALAPLEQLASRAPQLKGKGCAAILAALASGIPASARASTLEDGIDSLRVEDDRGFALYHGAGGVDYFMQMVKEDGEWKVAALAPVEFP